LHRITCLIVDDEALCRSHLRILAADHPDLNIVGEADSVQSAVEAVELLQPDLMFLDVQLGIENGFSVLTRLRHPPFVIFVTAYDDYAVRAFEVNAIDYLLKPVTTVRLRKALANAQRMRAVPEFLAPKPMQREDLALMPLGGSGFFTTVNDILLVEASNHHSRLTLDSGRTCTVRRSMREWVKLLPEATFQPLDRSYLINLERIQAVECSSRGGTVLLGSRRLEVSIGRAAARRLRTILHTVPFTDR
jgi:two-component system LytT family response regulator